MEIRNPYKYRDCPECNGDGYLEYLSCSKPQSDCCGGCYKRETCDYCEGEGELADEEYGAKFLPFKDRFYINKERLKKLRKR